MKTFLNMLVVGFLENIFLKAMKYFYKLKHLDMHTFLNNKLISCIGSLHSASIL